MAMPHDVPAPLPRRCAHCGVRLRWPSMRVHTQLGGESLRANVLHWKADELVEVRLCEGCSQPIARLVRRA